MSHKKRSRNIRLLFLLSAAILLIVLCFWGRRNQEEPAGSLSPLEASEASEAEYAEASASDFERIEFEGMESETIESEAIESSEPVLVEAEASAESEDASERAKEIIAGMTLHEKICQLFVVFPETITNVSAVQAAGSVTESALEAWPVGGFIYNKKNFVSQEQVTDMLAGVQEYADIPLILTCDEEGGRVNRLMSTIGTTYVGAMLDYKEDGVDKARENANIIATDMVACGFNTDLAPVADVWSNPENTVIGDRAYSDDFEQAAELVAAAVEGFHEAGIVTTLKHFPGHGDTSADSHYGAVYVEATLEELREKELLPFQAGINAGADMVMIGHLIVSDIDSEPAPFSYTIVTKLLREELGFDGVVITDALQMKAMTDYYGSGEIAVKAIAAGVDMLLCPMDFEASVASLTQAVETGEISLERLEESVARILVLKIQNGFYDEPSEYETE